MAGNQETLYALQKQITDLRRTLSETIDRVNILTEALIWGGLELPGYDTSKIRIQMYKDRLSFKDLNIEDFKIK